MSKITSLLEVITIEKCMIELVTQVVKEETKANQKDIVKDIEDRLKKVKPDQMLPIMYLIDSIIKNIGGPYIELFQQNLVSTFTNIFRSDVQVKSFKI